jgi:hypothetical protein
VICWLEVALDYRLPLPVAEMDFPTLEKSIFSFLRSSAPFSLSLSLSIYLSLSNGGGGRCF